MATIVETPEEGTVDYQEGHLAIDDLDQNFGLDDRIVTAVYMGGDTMAVSEIDGGFDPAGLEDSEYRAWVTPYDDIVYTVGGPIYNDLITSLEPHEKYYIHLSKRIGPGPQDWAHIDSVVKFGVPGNDFSEIILAFGNTPFDEWIRPPLVTGVTVTATDPSGAVTKVFKMAPPNDPAFDYIEDLESDWIITKVERDGDFEAVITPHQPSGFTVDLTITDDEGNDLPSSYVFAEQPPIKGFPIGLSLSQTIRGRALDTQVFLASGATGTGQMLYNGSINGSNFLTGSYFESTPIMNEVERMVYEVSYQDGDVISSTLDELETFSWGEEVVVRKSGGTLDADGKVAGGGSKIETWTFHEGTAATAVAYYGRTKSYTSNAGPWSYYQYNSTGSLIATYGPYGTGASAPMTQGVNEGSLVSSVSAGNIPNLGGNIQASMTYLDDIDNGIWITKTFANAPTGVGDLGTFQIGESSFTRREASEVSESTRKSSGLAGEYVESSVRTQINPDTLDDVGDNYPQRFWGRTRFVERGNGLDTKYHYALGNWNEDLVDPTDSEFIEDQNGVDYQVIEETLYNLAPVPNLSTRTIRYYSQLNGIVRSVMEVFITQWEPATITDYVKDSRGRTVKVIQDGREVSATAYTTDLATGNDIITSTDEQGTVTVQNFDQNGRFVNSVQLAGATSGITGVGDLTTEYIYNGLETTVLVNGRLHSLTERNSLGQTVRTIDRIGTETLIANTFNGAGLGTSRTATIQGSQLTSTQHISASGQTWSGFTFDGNGLSQAWSVSSGIEDQSSGIGYPSSAVNSGGAGVGKTVTRWDGSTFQQLSPDPSQPGLNNIGNLSSLITLTYTYSGENTHGKLARVSSSIAGSTDQVLGYPSNADAVFGTGSYQGVHRDPGEDNTGFGEFTRQSQSLVRYEKEQTTGKIQRITTQTSQFVDSNGDLKTNQTVTTQNLNRLSGEYSHQLLPTGEEITNNVTYNRPAKEVVSTTSYLLSSGKNEVTVSVNGFNVSSKSAPNDVPTEYRYYADGNLERVKDPRGGIQRFTYNALGQRQSTIAEGKTTHYTYNGPGSNAPGQVATFTNHNNELVETKYDGLGRVSEITGDGAYRRVYTYSPSGRLSTLTTFRDAANSATTAWIYDEASGKLLHKVINFSDSDGNGWASLGEEAGHSDVTSYQYDAYGNLFQKTSARGVITTYLYNGFGDLLTQTYTGDNDLTPDLDFDDHDGLNRPGEVVYGASSTSFEYDSVTGTLSNESHTGYLGNLELDYHDPDTVGRPKGYQLTRDGAVNLSNVTYTYNSESQLWKLTTTGGAPREFEYGYYPNSNIVHTLEAKSNSGTTVEQQTINEVDLYGRMKAKNSFTLSNSQMELITRSAYRYNAANRRDRHTREDGSYWQYSYNSKGEVTSGNKHLADGALLAGQQFGYDYDGIGNRTSATFGGDKDGNNKRNITYTQKANNTNQYDEIAREPYFNVIARAPAGFSLTFSADKLDGTPIPMVVDPVQGTYHRAEGGLANNPGLDQIDVTVSDGSDQDTGYLWYVSSIQREMYFDLDGNLTEDDKWTYIWDGENRLVKMELLKSSQSLYDVITIEFTYDWRGRRIGKTVKRTPHGSTAEQIDVDRRYVYDGWNLIAEFDMKQTSATNQIFREYFWGLDLSGSRQGAGGVGGLLAVHHFNTNEITYPSYDGNGNIISWSKSQGSSTNSALLQKRDYDPFGNLINKEDHGAIPGGEMPYGFSTKYEDAETGLLYYGYRYYDPVTGRWPSRDPIGERGGINLYGMVGNNIVGRFDVLGLDQFRVKYLVEGTIDEGTFWVDYEKVKVGDLRGIVDVELKSGTELVATNSNVLVNQTGKEVIVNYDIWQAGDTVIGNGDFWPEIDDWDAVWWDSYEHARLSLKGGLKITNGVTCEIGTGVEVDFKVIVSAGTITDTKKENFGIDLKGVGGKSGWETGYTASNQGFTVEGYIRYRLCPCTDGTGTWNSEYIESGGEAVGDSNAEKWHVLNDGLLRTYFHRY